MKNFSINDSFSVLIPDGETANALSIVRCLGETKKNIKIFVLAKGSGNPVRYSRYVYKYMTYTVGESRMEKVEKVEAILNAIGCTNADVLLPLDIATIRLLAENKDLFSKIIAVAPVPDVKSFDSANDKWLLSLWLKENGIGHPETILFKKNENLDAILSSLSFPLIIKPTLGFGGNGIHIIQTAEELRNWNKEFDHSEDYIFQSYIKGYDIDCSIISVEGKIFIHTIQKSIKYSKDDPWAYAMDFEENAEVLKIVTEIVEKFKWSGVNNIALRYDEDTDQFKIIEMNPRFWASVLATIFTGVNFPYTSCLLALHREVPEVQLTPKIVIRSKDAAKMMVKRLTNQDYLHYDNTYLELTIKDPLPTLMKQIF